VEIAKEPGWATDAGERGKIIAASRALSNAKASLYTIARPSGYGCGAFVQLKLNLKVYHT